ncbi:hypothetical protein L7F22_066320 [Adiantum nelumboides]|nr:hypothetical protein [Adiantum nelumboides]
MKKHVKLPDSTSNNEAEYHILLHGLQVCVSQKIRHLMVKGDALLIVKKILGIWAYKNERLREKVQAIHKLFDQFEEVQLYHIPRKQNEVADLLAQKAVACDESEVQVILAATAIKQPRYQGMESLAPIVSYILEGEFPQSFTKAQKQRLMEKANSYLFLEGALYQRGKDQVCRRIPTVEEIPSILEGLHEEACGGHFAQELTAKKILLSGYVWPSLHIDVQHWCKSCHNCQVNGNKHLLHGPRQLVLANGPFEKWGIDAMGPLPRTKNGKLYILVAIDYMTRWVEAQSVTRVNEKTVSRFVYTHICCRFGTPLEIVFDNGPGFRKGLLTEVCEELHILHRHSTPYYPQSNGLVEKANGIIAGIIRKMVKNKTKLWDDFLDGALWAYRTTYKEDTEFTPFHLVYGQEALQPIELNIPTMRLHGKAAQRKEEEWTDRLLTLAELEWKREVAYECYKRKATQVKDKLDKEVKDKGIKEGDLVLRYDNRHDNRFNAKFETRWQGPYIVKKAFNSSYYQLMDLDGKEHPRKVNGYRVKPYLSQILLKDLQVQRQKSTLSHKSCSLVQEPQRSNENPNDERLALVLSDLCGPMPSLSLGGAAYFCTFIDDYSRKVWVFLVKHKDEVLKAFKTFLQLVENQSGQKLKCLGTDNGGEYVSKAFQDFCKAKGIKRELIAPYNPSPNGVAECKMGHIFWDLESRKVLRSNDVYFNEANFHAKPENIEEIRRVVFKEDGPSSSTFRQHGQAQEQPIVVKKAESVVVRRSERVSKTT